MKITSKRRRPLIMLSLFALAFVLSAIGVFPVRRALTARMSDLRHYISAVVERDYGLKVSYRSLSPSILRSLEIRGLTVQSSLTGSTILTAKRVSVYYDIVDMLSGKVSRSLREIRLTGAAADLDLDRDSALLDRFRGILETLSAQGSNESSMNPLRIRCRDLSAALGTREGRISVKKASTDIAIGVESLDARLSMDAAFSANAASTLPDFSVSLQAEGSSDIRLERARFQASVSGRSESMDLARQKFLVKLESGTLEAQRVPDRSPIDAKAILDLDGLAYRLDMSFEGYRLSEMLRLRGAYESMDPWLACGLSGSLALNGDAKGGISGYAASAEASVPERLIPGKGKLSVDVRGNAAEAEIREIAFRSANGSVAYSGSLDLHNFLPKGSLRVGYRLGNMDAAGDFLLKPENGGLSVISENASLTGERLLSFAIDAFPAKDGLDFELRTYLESDEGEREASPLAGTAFSQEALSDDQAPRIEANGSLSFGKSPFAEFSAYLSRVPSSFIYGVAANAFSLPSGTIAAFASDFTVSAEAFVSTDFSKYSYNLPQIVLSYDKKAGNYGVLSVSGGSTSFEASKIALFWNGYSLTGRLVAEMPEYGASRVSANFKIGDVPYELAGRMDKSGNFSFSGGYGFSADGSFDGTDLMFVLGMRDMPLPLSTFTPRVSLNAVGRFRDLSDWELSIDSSSLEQTGGFLPSYARISFDGYFNGSGGRLGSIALQDSYSELRGKAELGYSLEGDRHVDLDLSLSSGGPESYSANLSLRPDSVSGRAVVSNAPVARFAPKSLGGLLSLEAALKGSLGDPVLDFSGSLSQANFNENILSAKAKGRYASRKFDLDDFSCSYFIFKLSGGKGSYSLADSAVDFKADCSAVFSPTAIFTSSISGSGKAEIGNGALASLKGNLDDIELGSIRIDRWPYSLSSGDGKIRLEIGKDRYASAEIDSAGNFAMQMDSPLAIRGFADGRVAGGRIDADVRNATVDFPVIWKIFGSNEIEIPSGEINADFKVTGNLSDPDFSGSGMARGIVFKLPRFLKDAFGPVDAALEVDSKDISVEGFRAGAQAAKGAIDVSLGVQLDGWLPSLVKLKAKTAKDLSVRAATKISGIDAEGNADADLSIDVSQQELLVTGSIFMQDTSIVLDTGREAEVPDTGDMEIKAKLQIGFGRKVEFLWPLRKLPILRTYFEPSSGLSVGYDSGSGTYTLKGSTKLRGGEVFYLKRNFYLKEGSILFNENQSFFDPIVNLKAEMRDRDSAGDILITMKVENSRLSQFKARFESMPSKSEGEILAMLGSPEAKEMADNSAMLDWAIDSTSDVLAQFYGVRLFENTVRDTFGLDMFSVRTQVLQKLLLGTVDNAPSLGEYFDNTTLMAGKYIGSDLYLQTTVRALVGDQKDSTGNLELDSEFSMEWNTPYFKLLWNLQPEHWEDLLVSDQSLGIYWSFSY